MPGPNNPNPNPQQRTTEEEIDILNKRKLVSPTH